MYSMSKCKMSPEPEKDTAIDIGPATVCSTKGVSENRRIYLGIRNHFRDYCDNSSIIGFKYLGERRSRGERILWFVIILIAMALSAYHIWEIYHKYEENPFIVNFATRESPIYTIPFPAVTICPVVKTVRERFNFTRAVHNLFDNISLDEDEMMKTQYLSSVCENIDFPYRDELPPNDTFTDEFYDQLNYVIREVPLKWSTEQNSTEELYLNMLETTVDPLITEIVEANPNEFDMDIVFQPDGAPSYYSRGMEPGPSTFFICFLVGMQEHCNRLFVPIVLDDGICYTSNMLSREDIYKDDVVHYKNYHQTSFKSNWSIEDGYSKAIDIGAYPRRAFLAGADSAMEIYLLQQGQDVDYLCSKDTQGYKVVLHTPQSVPQMKKQYIAVPLDSFVQAMVQPRMMTTSKEVKHFKPTKRLCYFADERYLKYFKIYNPENCGLECLTNYTLETCGCVNFYMPRNNSTHICGNAKTDCMRHALLHMKKLELIRQFTRLHAGLDCNCMPLCTELSYDADTSRSFFTWREQVKAEKRLFESINTYYNMETKDLHLSKLSVFFKRDQFLTSQRNELYGFFDFLANFGGLLGLFTGFSLLSAVEILYYLTVRLWCNLAKGHEFPRYLKEC